MTEEQPVRREWLPRTNQEKLIKIDGLLDRIAVGFGDAVDHAADLVPGHSGRPAGTGDPGGGSAGFGDTVVERQVIAVDGGLRGAPAEARALDDLLRLAGVVVAQAEELVRVSGWSEPGPLDNGPVRRLLWARWALRILERLGVKLPSRGIDRLWRDVVALEQLVTIYGPGRESPAARSDELADDDTEQWCRSHLRVGDRRLRSKAFVRDGLCETCGRFQSEQGFLPTLAILDALVSGKAGSTIAKMIRDERASRVRTRPKKKRRR